MRIHTRMQCFLTVFILWFVNIGYNAQTLGLYEGDICLKGSNSTYNSICKNIDECPAIVKQMIAKNYSAKICSFDGESIIVCCPPDKTDIKKKKMETYSAKEMCTKYSELIYTLIPDPVLLFSKKNKYIKRQDCYQAHTLISNGTEARPKEFPHMVLLNYHEIPNYKSFSRCGGSLISKNFVLTAAHCEKFGHGDSLKYATWARLGELDYLSDNDGVKPINYKIVERIIHPLYRPEDHYHDIALFRLENDVVFSPHIRPICLNTNNSFNPQKVVATGWGKTGESDGHSSHLLKATIETNPAKECDTDLTTINTKNTNKIQTALPRVNNVHMVCSVVKSGMDTCQGDSGGPIQVAHEIYTCMYSQIGITSFGSIACGYDKESSVYTRVSYYISWIEEIVWPKIDQ